MGEVYRARDTRLDRIVAIKILSTSFASDPDRLRRFEQEARTVAALNHPNILGIHDIGTYDGTPYLVSELLQGTTLREKLESGPLPSRRVSELALGIALGLAAAHEKGIVHRDLKPENIFLTDDGRVKILDFGLAKLTGAESKGHPDVTMTSPVTLPGVVMGTVGYMSPEQVRGDATDARSDIFSFGAVLYEMLSGKRAFKRDTAAETMTAILREEPAELSTSGWHGSPGWERILSRCLEKLPSRRFQSASDLAFAIESLSGSSVSVIASSPSSALAPLSHATRWRGWWIGMAAALALAAAALFAGRWSVKTHPVSFTRLTYTRGLITNARFAKDEQTVVYSAQFNNDPLAIYSVRSEYPQSVKVDLPNAHLLALSPAGDLSLALNAVLHSHFYLGTLAQSPMSGGSPRPIQDGVISADYSPDGKSLAVTRMANGKARVEFPVGKSLYETSGYLDYVRVSPGGDRVVFAEHPFFGDDRGFVSTIDASGKRKQLTKEFESIQGIAWVPDGREIWFTAADSGQSRQMLGVDLSGKVRQVFHAPDGMTLFDIGADGRVLMVSESDRFEVTTVDVATGKQHRGLEWFDGSMDPDVSPDGKAILFFEFGGPAGLLYKSVYRKLDGSAPVDLGPGSVSRFSPDGKTAAALLLTSPVQVALYPIGAGQSRTIAIDKMVNANWLDWFPDGKRLFIVGALGNENLRTYVMDSNGGTPQPLGPADWRARIFSPDGRRIAGSLGDGAAIYDVDTQKTQNVSGIQADDKIFAWSEDGKGLLVFSDVLGGFSVTRVNIADGKRTPLQSITEDDKTGLSDLHVEISPDRKTYAYSASRSLSTLYVAEGIQ